MNEWFEMIHNGVQWNSMDSTVPSGSIKGMELLDQQNIFLQSVIR